MDKAAYTKGVIIMTPGSRGAATAGDVFARDWDYWAHVETTVEELRQRCGVPPLAQ